MPDDSGFEICEKVRQVSKVPIIFLTVSDEETSVVTGLDIGGDDYITKPFKLGILISRMNALLRHAKDFNTADAEVFDGAFFTYKSNLYIPTEVKTANELFRGGNAKLKMV